MNLEEDVLNEATEPQYRNIILELIYYITSNEDLKKLIENEKESLQFHHIDSMYLYTERYNKKGKHYRIGKAINNKPQNIAIVTENAHEKLTNINTEIKNKMKELGKTSEEAVPEILDKFNEQLIELEGQIFPLLDCLPPNIVNSLSTIIDD